MERLARFQEKNDFRFRLGNREISNMKWSREMEPVVRGDAAFEIQCGAVFQAAALAGLMHRTAEHQHQNGVAGG